MYCLLEVVGVAKEKIALQFVKHLDWIKVSCLEKRKLLWTLLH